MHEFGVPKDCRSGSVVSHMSRLNGMVSQETPIRMDIKEYYV